MAYRALTANQARETTQKIDKHLNQSITSTLFKSMYKMAETEHNLYQLQKNYLQLNFMQNQLMPKYLKIIYVKLMILK